MIKYEKEYLEFILAMGVGNKDVVASSPKSYISYLNTVSKLIDSDIKPGILSKEDDITLISNKLKGKRKIKTISNYKSAMRQYVRMLKLNGLVE